MRSQGGIVIYGEAAGFGEANNVAPLEALRDLGRLVIDMGRGNP